MSLSSVDAHTAIQRAETVETLLAPGTKFYIHLIEISYCYAGWSEKFQET